MYRAITIQSKDVVDLLLRGETYRCELQNRELNTSLTLIITIVKV